MAAPHVAGACALLWELHPTKTYSEVKNDVLDAVDIIPSLHGKTLSGGRLNLCKLLGACQEDVACTFSDSLTLVNFYKATNGINWLNTWNLDTSIDLSNNQLVGVIPPELGNLSSLQLLDLSYNQLAGIISPKFGQLTNLQTLDFSNNQLEGPLLAELGDLTSLQSLDCSNNQLEGTIPIEFSRLIKLDTLILSNNQIEGHIPKELGELPNLKLLYLQNNQLYGCFNQSLEVFCTIDYDLSNNLFPEAFSDFCDTGEGYCKPCGIVDSFALVALYEVTNGLNWTRPWNLQEPMSTWDGITLNSEGCVIGIELDNNNLNGRLPINLLDPQIPTLSSYTDNLSSLIRLSLCNNQLKDGLSTELGNLPNLKTLLLDGNQLTGRIPIEIGKLSNLDSLSISNNQLSDTIPKELGNLAKLSWLSFENNQLIGNIPVEIGQLTNIKTLDLSNNQLTGFIPTTASNLYNLDTLSLSNNQLTGNIPAELSNLFNLVNLDLSNNQLTGNSFCDINTNLTNNIDLPGNGDFSAFCAGDIGQCTEPVWPGDFNNDGLVDQSDVLYWGLACEGITGPVRSNASTEWTEQESTNWSASINGVNNKHQDANGDGIINLQDYQVLIDNYGRTHNATIYTHATGGVTYRLEPLEYAGSTVILF